MENNVVGNVAFTTQVQRLKARFGEKAFDYELLKLISKEVFDMDLQDFIKIVDFMIGSRPTSRPPLVADFRDARLNLEKNVFRKDLKGAIDTFEKSWPKGLQDYLKKEYPGCKTAWAAVQVQVLRNQINKTNSSSLEMNF